MNKGLIADLVMRRVNKRKAEEENQEVKDIIRYIEEARVEMQAAREMFEFVNEPKLIEAAIYKEEAAIKRYEYLLALAKKREIKKNIE